MGDVCVIATRASVTVTDAAEVSGVGVTTGILSGAVTGGFSCVLDGVASFSTSSSEMLVGKHRHQHFPVLPHRNCRTQSLNELLQV